MDEREGKQWEEGKRKDFKNTTNCTEIKRIMIRYYEQLYTNTWDNLYNTDKSKESQNLPKQNQK